MNNEYWTELEYLNQELKRQNCLRSPYPHVGAPCGQRCAGQLSITMNPEPGPGQGAAGAGWGGAGRGTV